MSEWELYCESEASDEDFLKDAAGGFTGADAPEMKQKWLDLHASKDYFETWKSNQSDDAYERNFGEE